MKKRKKIHVKLLCRKIAAIISADPLAYNQIFELVLFNYLSTKSVQINLDFIPIDMNLKQNIIRTIFNQNGIVYLMFGCSQTYKNGTSLMYYLEGTEIHFKQSILFEYCQTMNDYEKRRVDYFSSIKTIPFQF